MSSWCDAHCHVIWVPCSSATFVILVPCGSLTHSDLPYLELF